MSKQLPAATVLIVEDEYLVAALLKQIVEAAGYRVSGPIPRVSEALATIQAERCDAALLDINLAGEPAYPVADLLSQRGIPFLFLTGYTLGSLPAEYAGSPRLSKPFRNADLLRALSGLIHPSPTG